ncbi:FAD-dependent oxidoreductase [Candidatus Saccharibacteria bacterium]|nr:FAD-dependent oxidoreductase [Candidatus Saccharibacteria bacterium]
MVILKLIEKKNLFSDVIIFLFEPETPVQWQPGQYMHYHFDHPEADERGVERWFTISTAPYEINLAITTRIATQKGSSFKQALKELPVGATIKAEGPKGQFVIGDTSKKPILVAGGIGITPYRSMLLQMDHDGKEINVDLLYANRDENFVFGDELKALQAKHPNFKIYKFMGDHHIQEADLKPYADDQDTIIYLSGPEPMIEAFEDTLKENLQVPEDRIKTDFFPGYPPE